LVYWKGFIAESNTWEGRENLENAQKAIEEFEKKYWQDKNKKSIRGPLTHDPRAPPVASQHNFIVQPLVTKE